MENIQFFDGLFSNDELDWIIQNDIVVSKRELLSETNHKIRFSIDLPENMKTKLQNLGLCVSNLDIPMMWINNDMSSHVDSGEDAFNETMLVYVSDANGSLIINNNTYEIQKNRAFKFQKGLEHSTENTGNEPRLLIGPMSETGFPVGVPSVLYYYADITALNSSVPDDGIPNNTGLYEGIGIDGIYTLFVRDDPYFLQLYQAPPGATLSGWAGKQGYQNSYTLVNYSPGAQFDGLPGNLYLYPVWTSNVMCFKEGTNILCLDQEKNTEKYIPIEDLRNGVLVKTLFSGYQPISMIGSTKMYNSGDKLRGKNRLYRCRKEKYPELTEDLIITGCHSILVYTITDKERADLEELMGKIYVTEKRYRLMACVDERAEPYEEEGLFTVWHFALEHEHIRANYGVYANGLLVESSSKRMMSEYSGMELLQ